MRAAGSGRFGGARSSEERQEDCVFLLTKTYMDVGYPYLTDYGRFARDPGTIGLLLNPRLPIRDYRQGRRTSLRCLCDIQLFAVGAYIVKEGTPVVR